MKQDALACLEAAIRAVDPARLVSEHLTKHVPPSGPVHIVGIGKAAGAMAAGARAVFGERLAVGTLIVPDRIEVERIPGVDVFHAGHPIPDARGAEGAGGVLRLAEGLGEDDLLLCLISGGGSALMTLPPEGVTLEEVQQTTDLLLRAGAAIEELNCVRKHLDRLKGGRLARLASPARVLALVLSDVVGDPLDTIASGPVSPDPTTFATAVRILEHRNVWAQLPDAVQNHLMRGLEDGTNESPDEGDPCFRRVEVRIVGNNRLAAEAARQEAERRGYRTRLLSTFVTGEAREVGGVLGAVGREARQSGEPIDPPACLVSGGETTVSVRGGGKGGRNQELVLGAALALDGVEGIVVASVGTDGIDGPTDAAGAVADGSTIERARAVGLDPHHILARSDSYAFFEALDDLILTGPTGTNVMDIQVVLVSAKNDRRPELRPARQEDAAQIAEIWYHGWRDGHLGHVSSDLVALRTKESFGTRAADRIGDTTVVVVEGRVAGFVMVVDDEVEQVYVSRPHRGSGVADVLMREAERLVRANGHTRAWLAVVAGNARARRFYERSGWTDDGPLEYSAYTESGSVSVPTRRYVKELD